MSAKPSYIENCLNMRQALPTSLIQVNRALREWESRREHALPEPSMWDQHLAAGSCSVWPRPAVLAALVVEKGGFSVTGLAGFESSDRGCCQSRHDLRRRGSCGGFLRCADCRRGFASGDDVAGRRGKRRTRPRRPRPCARSCAAVILVDPGQSKFAAAARCFGDCFGERRGGS